jgi:hypothetical protein
MTKHHIALSRCPKELFKALFVGSPLGTAFRDTKIRKAVPDGLKPQECEQRSGRVKQPIPYIPEKDELQEAVDRTASIKLTLLTKVDLRVSVWSRGTQEEFIMHVQQAITAIKGKGQQENYEKLVRVEKKCMENLKEAVLNHDLMEGEVRDDSPVAEAVQTATEAQEKRKVKAHGQPDFPTLLQLPLGRGYAALEQDPGQTNSYTILQYLTLNYMHSLDICICSINPKAKNITTSR